MKIFIIAVALFVPAALAQIQRGFNDDSVTINSDDGGFGTTGGFGRPNEFGISGGSGRPGGFGTGGGSGRPNRFGTNSGGFGQDNNGFNFGGSEFVPLGSNGNGFGSNDNFNPGTSDSWNTRNSLQDFVNYINGGNNFRNSRYQRIPRLSQHQITLRNGQRAIVSFF